MNFSDSQISEIKKIHPNIKLEKYYLGKVCKNNHLIPGTNKSLRMCINNRCYKCIIEDQKLKNSQNKLRTNHEQFESFHPSQEDKDKYKDANLKEIWIDLDGILDKINFSELRDNGEFYQVSNWGRIRFRTEKLLNYQYLRGSKNRSGRYNSIKIHRKDIMVHRIVAYGFFGEKPFENAIVRHLDDCGQKNYPCNLAWGSFSDNGLDVGKNNGLSKRKNFDPILSDEEILNEEWKEIDSSGFFISSMGRFCKFVDQKMTLISSKFDSKRGYIKPPSVRSLRKYTYVHTIVANCFIGEQKTKEKFLIRHLDGDKTNNKLTNLKFGSSKENAEDRKIHKGYNNPIGEKHGNSKLTSDEVIDIKIRLNKGESTISISKIYNVCRQTISSIKRLLVWAHIKV